MNQRFLFRILLENPLGGVWFGLQKGRASQSKVEQIQAATEGQTIVLHFWTEAKINEDGAVSLLGPYTQGTPAERFVYVNIGASAGQHNTPWNRRLKVPLSGITKERLVGVVSTSEVHFQARIAATAKDGSPCCGTVKPFGGWEDCQ
jgi:Family of unknown function (DUF5990)